VSDRPFEEGEQVAAPVTPDHHQVSAKATGRGRDLLRHAAFRRVPAIEARAQVMGPDLPEQVLERLFTRSPACGGLGQVPDQHDEHLGIRRCHGCHRRRRLP